MKFQGDISVGSRKLVGHLNRGTDQCHLLGFNKKSLKDFPALIARLLD